MKLEGLDLGIAKQTKLAAVGYGLLVFSLICLALLAMKTTNTSLMVTTILLTAVSALIGTYSINCMVTGSCHTLAWIISAALIVIGAFYMLLVVIFAIALVIARRKGIVAAVKSVRGRK